MTDPTPDLATPLTAASWRHAKRCSYERGETGEHRCDCGLFAYRSTLDAARQPVAETALREAGQALDRITTEVLRVIDAHWSKSAKRDWVNGPIRHDINEALAAALATREPDPAPLDVERLARAMHDIGMGCMEPIVLTRDLCVTFNPRYQDPHPAVAKFLAAEYARLAHSKDEP